jgi:YD repeat-containing protein
MKIQIFFPLLLLALCSKVISSTAQVTNLSYVPTVVPQSPNSAAFSKYGDYPVNMFSGVPEISIPLYTVESGGLKVPITLSYHASGIKVTDVASWVGLGWSLSAGGSVTRNILGGRPDENGGYLVNYKDPSTIHTTVNSDLDYLYQAQVLRIWDTRPDMFSYNIPGYGGKFFFNAKDAYKITTIPFTPIAIRNSGSTTALNFTIQDEHGNAFLLGQNYRETTTTYSQSSIQTIGATAWMLEQMIAQNRRDTIKFTYASANINPPDQLGQSVIVEDREIDYPTESPHPSPYIQATTTVQTNTATAITEQRLQQIYFKNGRVDFTLSSSLRSDLNGGKALDNIKIYNYNYETRVMELQKTITFNTSYYLDSFGSAMKLRLDGITISDKSGTIIQRYSFAYNQLAIPNNLSYARDYWGYYNGKTSNVTLIPKTQIDYQPNPILNPTQVFIGGSNANIRDIDTTFMQAGVLTSIKYPTGGHTDFIYETNRYYDASNVMYLTGGLRVTSISSYDQTSGGTPIVKTYQYNKATPNFLSFGNAGQLNYGFFVHTATARYYEGANGNQKVTEKRVRSFLSEPSYNLTPGDGNPVAYESVTEYTGTPIVNTGKTIYTYRFKADEVAGTTGATQNPIEIDYSFARGQLLSKKSFTNVGGIYKPVHEEINTYTAFPQKTYADVGFVIGMRKQTENRTVAYVNQQTDDDSDTYPFGTYSIASDDNYLTGTISKTYDISDTTKTITDAVAYKFDNIKHQQVSRTIHADSRGNTTVSKSKYPADYLIGSATSTNNAVLDAMLTNNMQAEAIEKWDSVQTVSSVVNGVTGGQLNVFKAGQIAGTIVPSAIGRLNVSAPVTNFDTSKVVSGNLTADSRYVQMINFNKYDSKNNIVQYSPRNATPTYILWDYLQAMPIAQVKNMVSTVPETAAAYTSFEAPGKGNWTFSGTSSVSSTAPTGSRVYALWSGAVTSPFPDVFRTYVVSYWSDDIAATVSFIGVNYPGTAIRKSNGWTCYEHRVPVSDILGKITLSGNMQIDELRMYPSDAQITTYTYNPDGLTHITDPKNQVSRFEYDPFGRLKNIKDWNGNIVKNFGYHYYDSLIAP